MLAARRRRRVGLTLMELLVVTAIIAILLGLLLPATQRAREAAARIQCGNNLKQIALATHAYHDVNGFFPVNSLPTPTGPYGSTEKSWSWLARILPYIEQGVLYKQGNIPDNTLYQSRDVVGTRIAMFLCPTSDSGDGSPRNDEANLGDIYPPNITAGVTTYKGVSGSNWQWGDPQWHHRGVNGETDGLNYGDGIFYRYDWKSPKTMRDITDGTSQTFMIGEMVPQRTHWFAWAHANGSVATCAIVPNARRADGSYYDPWDWRNNVGFGSLHPGGLQFAYADGSVHFVSESIDLGVYRAMATIQGGEAVSPP